nr:MAG TPA: hypothetical protein [Caudoviricetes sp.]
MEPSLGFNSFHRPDRLTPKENVNRTRHASS